LNFNPAITGSVASIAVQADDKVLIGGSFTFVEGTARTNIARLNANGTLDTSFQNGLAGANNIVRSIVPQGADKIFSGESNQVVVVEASTNLMGNWFALSTNVLGAAPLPVNDPASANLSRRFYRARVQ